MKINVRKGTVENLPSDAQEEELIKAFNKAVAGQPVSPLTGQPVHKVRLRKVGASSSSRTPSGAAQ